MRFVFAVNGWFLGGFVTFCRNLATGLRSRGHEADLLILPEAELRRQVVENMFNSCLVVPRGFRRTRSHVERAGRAIDALKPDVLVINDCPYAMAALPLIRQATFRMSVIHNVEPDEVELGLTSPQWWDRVVAVSDCVASAVVERGFRERLSVCPYGVPLPTLGTVRAAQPERTTLQLISVSRLVRQQKRMDRLPGIANLLTERKVDFHWSVLGSGDYLPQLRQDLKNLGLEHRFSFKGSVSPSEVGRSLAKADVFVMPSDYEGLPQALLEAMAHGVIPVVSRLEGSTTCAVEHGISGFLCEPSQAGEFAEAILKLASDPALRLKMHVRAAETMAREFSLEAFTKRFLTVVEEGCSRDNRRAPPLASSAIALEGKARPLRCLGFWRSVRHQTLGQLKRGVLRSRFRSATGEGALEATLG